MSSSFDQLKQKYQSAISLAQNSGHLQNVNMEGEKLFVRAEVANQDIKNNIWNAIKAIDPNYTDLVADININSSLPQPATPAPAPAAAAANASSAHSSSSARTYTVKPGDTLSKIAQEFYGKAGAYNKIFQANRDKLKDADHIRPGQELVIPA